MSSLPSAFGWNLYASKETFLTIYWILVIVTKVLNVVLFTKRLNLQKQYREPKPLWCASPPTQCDRGKPERVDSGTHFKKWGSPGNVASRSGHLFSVLFKIDMLRMQTRIQRYTDPPRHWVRRLQLCWGRMQRVCAVLKLLCIRRNICSLPSDFQNK